MKLGDIPELRRLRGEDPEVCPQCGGPKKPGFRLCRDCTARSRSSSSPRGPSRPAAPAPLPDELIFTSFYDDKHRLKEDLFYEKPQRLADLFRQAGLTPHALRLLYQGFQAFAVPLRDSRIDFDAAAERFGIFYVERVVRQMERGHLPAVVKEFFDRHLSLARSSREEMLGLFRYLTNVLCYFGDKEEATK